MRETIGVEGDENRTGDRKQAETDPGGEHRREIDHLQGRFLGLRGRHLVDDAAEQERFGELSGGDRDIGDRQKDREPRLRRELRKNALVDREESHEILPRRPSEA